MKTLTAPVYAKALRTLDLLEQNGPDLGMPFSKPLGDGLFELRVRSGQEIRIFYVFHTHREIFLLHAFQKKTQQTPKNELEIARKRRGQLT